MLPAPRCCSRSIPGKGSRKYATDAKPARAVQAPRRTTFGAPSKRPPPRPMSNGLWNPLPIHSLRHPLFEPQHRADTEQIIKNRKRLKLGALAQDDIGQCKGFGNQKNDVVRVFGVPRNLLKEFRLQTTPSTVVRHTTIDIQNLLSSTSSSSRENRHVIAGPPGCGKSHLLLQALALAQSVISTSPNWIVLSFPRCGKLINGSTAYAYDARTKLFAQNAFASETLLRLWNANSDVLSQLKTAQDWTFVSSENSSARGGESGKVVDGGGLKKGAGLKTLIELGWSRESGIGAVVLEAVFEELAAQSTHPVLLAIDELEALFCDSAYKTPAFHTIKAWHLSMPRLLLEYLSGRKAFNNGIVLSATSSQSATHAPPHLATLLTGSSNSIPTKPIDPYATPLKAVEAFAQGLKPIHLGTLDIREAIGVFDLWRQERVLGSSPTFSSTLDRSVQKLELKIMEKSPAAAGGSAGDERFLGTYAESGGNAREMVWRGLLNSLAG